MADASPMAGGFFDLQAVGRPVDVRSVVHDKAGFLWYASNRGVCRFDGSDSVCPTDKGALALSIDAMGRVWAGMDDGQIALVAGVSVYMHTHVAGQIAAIAVGDSAGWVATTKGLFVFDTKNSREPPRRVWPEATRLLLPAKDGAVFAVADQDVVTVSQTTPRRPFAHLSHQVTAIGKAASPDEILVGTSNGAVLVVGARTVRPLPTPNNARAAIRSVAVDAASNIWVGTENEFFVVTHPTNQIVMLEGVKRLPHPHVKALDVDAWGNLWMGTPSGLARLRPSHPVRKFAEAEGLASQVTFAVDGGPTGRVWAVTGAGLSHWDGHSWSGDAYEKLGLDSYDARTLAVDPRGNVWVGGTETGLYQLKGSRLIRTWPRGPQPGMGVRSLRTRRGGGLWVGLARGGLGSFTDDKFTLEFQPAAAHQDLVFDMAEPTEGDGVWLALSHSGLARWRQRSLSRYGAAEGIPAAEILCLLPGDDGDLWVGTNGAGLLHVRDEHITIINSGHGLADDRVFGLVDDGDGRIWMTGPMGISGVPKKALLAVAQGRGAALEGVVSHGSEDGVPGEPVRSFAPAAHRAADGTLWFPTLRGIVNVDPRVPRRRRRPSRIVFDDVSVNGLSMLDPGRTPAASRHSNIRFAFAFATDGTHPNLRVRYRLHGLDPVAEPWHQTTTVREARYLNASPGDYRFVVQASSVQSDGTTQTQEAHFDLHLPKPWQDTWAFRLLLIGMVVGGAVLAHRRRVRRIEAGHSALSSERQRIARDIHDSLEQDLLGLRFQVAAAAARLLTEPEVASRYLQRASDLICDSVVDLRNSIWGLRAADVNTHELMNAIRARLDRVTAPVAVTADSNFGSGPRVLSAFVASHFLQVASECVTNALKHARATAINVTLESDEARLRLTVADNGRGFDLTAPPREEGRHDKGRGLAGMQERARSVGGELQVQSSESGTKISLSVAIADLKLKPKVS